MLQTMLVAVLLYATPQKPTLGTVTDEIKNSAAIQVEAAKKASADLHKDVEQARQAAVKQGIAIQQKLDKESSAKTSTEARLKVVEATLAATEKSKAEALQLAATELEKSEAKSEANWISIRNTGYGLVAGLLLSSIVGGFKLFRDRAHHKREETSLQQIHAQLDGNITLELKDKLVAYKITLASLLEMADMKQQTGLAISTDATDAILEMKIKIAELSGKIIERAVVEKTT